MIRIYSIVQALALKGKIPTLAVVRSLQFQGDGYCPEEHGHIVVLEQGDELSAVTEVGIKALIDGEGFPTYDLLEAYRDDNEIVYEIVFQIDNSRTIAVILPEESRLGRRIRRHLNPAPLPMPEMKGEIS